MSNTYSDLPNTKFPDQVDDFSRMRDLSASEVVLMEQYQALIKAKDITSAQNLIENNPGLKVVLFNAFNVNNIGDAVKSLERFFNSNVNGFIQLKQTEMTTFITDKKTEVNNFTTAKMDGILTYTNNKQQETTDFVNIKQAEIKDKKDYFINLVNQKEIQLSEMDTRTKRYWQKWNSTIDGQVEYDIFTNGFNLSLPPEAILNIDPENIDLSINGSQQIPYEDYEIKADGQYKKIIIKGNAKNLIVTGTEVIIKYYKNVGKLYFKHASTHQEGGYDPIIITENMLDTNLKDKIGNNVIQSATKPVPKKGMTWLRVIE
ncbi:hypothetical protein G9F71_008225 [Clostridium sp. FP2]|uniref:hypothetical protein n=1 Tax=Clostridium sp. FP2 TaxID=2724481 RepID=UPI0013E97718|nr:hypothetical protein [Clostridium sp. FP2]MBZ9622837.1 hypothetical protein [Clostridium sp. FP2]